MNYKTICIILARGGSKGIPLKNLKKINGISLIRRALNSAIEASFFDKIIVSSDDPKILNECLHESVDLHSRSKQASSDNATSENALAEVLDYFEIDIGQMFLVQCTTPLITAFDYLKIQELSLKYPNNTVVSGYVESIHHWVISDEKQIIRPLLGSGELRKPRQSVKRKIFVENGGIYSIPISGFLNSGNRFSKNVIAYVMSKRRSYDIDSPEDLEIVKSIMESKK